MITPEKFVRVTRGELVAALIERDALEKKLDARPSAVRCEWCPNLVPVRRKGNMPRFCCGLCRSRSDAAAMRAAADVAPLRTRGSAVQVER